MVGCVHMQVLKRIFMGLVDQEVHMVTFLALLCVSLVTSPGNTSGQMGNKATWGKPHSLQQPFTGLSSSGQHVDWYFKKEPPCLKSHRRGMDKKTPISSEHHINQLAWKAPASFPSSKCHTTGNTNFSNVSCATHKGNSEHLLCSWEDLILSSGFLLWDFHSPNTPPPSVNTPFWPILSLGQIIYLGKEMSSVPFNHHSIYHLGENLTKEDLKM